MKLLILGVFVYLFTVLIVITEFFNLIIFLLQYMFNIPLFLYEQLLHYYLIGYSYISSNLFDFHLIWIYSESYNQIW